MMDLVLQAVEEYGFVGIKMHRHDAPINREVCEAARAFSLPVLYDVTDEVAVCELLTQEYPEVNFIIPHLGSFADDWRAQLALIDHLVRHPNIYTDTAGVRSFDLLVEAVRRAGTDKVLFGSDGPWLHPGVELAKIQALGLPAGDAALVLGGNFLRLIGKAGLYRGRAPAANRRVISVGVARACHGFTSCPWLTAASAYQWRSGLLALSPKKS